MDAARETRKKAEAMAIQLDESHLRLLVKYHARNHDPQVRVGVLALLHNDGETAPEKGKWRAHNSQLDMCPAGTRWHLQPRTTAQPCR